MHHLGVILCELSGNMTSLAVLVQVTYVAYLQGQVAARGVKAATSKKRKLNTELTSDLSLPSRCAWGQGFMFRPLTLLSEPPA